MYLILIKNIFIENYLVKMIYQNYDNHYFPQKSENILLLSDISFNYSNFQIFSSYIFKVLDNQI